MNRWIWLLAFFWCAAACAHKPSDAYVFLVADGPAVSARWDVALRDLDTALNLDASGNRELTWGEVKQQRDAIAQLLSNHLSIARGGQACALAWSGFATEQRSDGNYLVTSASTQCGKSGDAVTVRYTLFAQTDATHRGILSATIDGKPLAAVLDPAASHAAHIGSTAPGGFMSFVTDGMHHILIGWDHILFLICLLLPCVLIRHGHTWQAAPRFAPVAARIALTVTAFTVAHSVTLALAAFELVQPPPRQIEALIAVTVMFAAINNIVPLVRERIAALAFAFGLIHGFGFANVLAELELPRERFATALLGFNIGVELGQLLIVAAALAVLYPLRSLRFYAPAVLKGGSVVAFLLASVWLAERVFDLSIISA